MRARKRPPRPGTRARATHLLGPVPGSSIGALRSFVSVTSRIFAEDAESMSARARERRARGLGSGSPAAEQQRNGSRTRAKRQQASSKPTAKP